MAGGMPPENGTCQSVYVSFRVLYGTTSSVIRILRELK